MELLLQYTTDNSHMGNTFPYITVEDLQYVGKIEDGVTIPFVLHKLHGNFSIYIQLSIKNKTARIITLPRSAMNQGKKYIFFGAWGSL